MSDLLIREMTRGEKPREKFAEHGPELLTSVELLAILLRTGRQGRSVLDVARDTLREFPNEDIYYLGSVTWQELTSRISGIGRDKAITICAAVEIGKRIARQQAKRTRQDFSEPQAVAGFFMEEYRYLTKERFTAAYLSIKNKLITYRVLTEGGLNGSIAEPRDVFRYALQYNAAHVILIHNHPSGDPDPSSGDIGVTKRMKAAGELMGIEILDHIIIGDGVYVSLMEQGCL